MKTTNMKLQGLERMAPELVDQTPHTEEEYIAAVERVIEAMNRAFRVPPDHEKVLPLSEKRKRETIRNRRAMATIETEKEKWNYIFRVLVFLFSVPCLVSSAPRVLFSLSSGRTCLPPVS